MVIGTDLQRSLIGFGALSRQPRNTLTVSQGTVEEITRPFGTAQLLIDRLLARRVRDGETLDAIIRWGQAASFSFTTAEIPVNGVSVNIEDEDAPFEESKQETWDETGRTTKDIRVENPSDADQFVIVQRIETITFQRPDGISILFDLNHPDPT